MVYLSFLKCIAIFVDVYVPSLDLTVYPNIFFFLNDTAPPEIYTLPLHDALPISLTVCEPVANAPPMASVAPPVGENEPGISLSGSLNCTLLMPSLSPSAMPLLDVVVPLYCRKIGRAHV